MKQKSDHEIDSVLDMKNKSIFFLILAKIIVEIFRQCQWRVKFKKKFVCIFQIDKQKFYKIWRQKMGKKERKDSPPKI